MYGDKDMHIPDTTTPRGLPWKVPPLKELWFGARPEDDGNRMKAFLSCMRSETANMCNTTMVPQRLLILCCVLRYLVQQEKAVVTQGDIDVFLAQALSSQLTLEHRNSQNLANIKLAHVDA